MMDVSVKARVRKGWLFLLCAAGDLAGGIILVASFMNGWLGDGLMLVGIAFCLFFAAIVTAFLGMRELGKIEK